MDGCLSVFKPRGCSSHDVVDRIRKAYGERAGHAGTLDPMAQGVLVIFLGQALKILHFLPTALLDKDLSAAGHPRSHHGHL
jgi:tRNA pseudouridine55 synthase